MKSVELLPPIVAVACFFAGDLAGQERPVFRGSTDLVVVETQVVDRDGRPLAGLASTDFEVKIGGRVRRVASVDVAEYAGPDWSNRERSRQSVDPPSVLHGPAAEHARMFVIAVDEFSFEDHGLLPALQDAKQFVARLPARDWVGLYGFPTGRTVLAPTRDRAAIIARLGPALGARSVPPSHFNLSPSEVVDASAGDREVLNLISERECGRAGTCNGQIMAEARILGSFYESEARQRMRGLRSMFADLAKWPSRKTVVMLTAGFLASDLVGGRPQVSSEAIAAGDDAAHANATLYVLQTDTSFNDAMSVRRRGARVPSIRRRD